MTAIDTTRENRKLAANTVLNKILCFANMEVQFNKIGAFIRKRRKELKMTGQELADKSGLSLRAIWYLEKQERVTEDSIAKVLPCLGYSLDQIKVVIKES